ncbi:MAG TPA: carbohydrate ABC transporter permease [Devosia sp.]|jgi:ABC-type glycerol-3-phosphate transport system permease component|uniref:carbohydrate ABC transporter permease n=1 Tax=Devosia sp. TaxID=1871048 RepID=UPI002DDCD127|nr:carbohydrate ABC transporter permease [Devosia sp.]HEV2516059.1 carbohydrate ABC transporter permease [Devosia sp.]
MTIAVPAPNDFSLKGRRATDPGGLALTVLTCACITAVFALPMLWIVLKSIQPESEVFSNNILPSSLTLDNYARAVKSGHLLSYTLSTVLLAIATCCLVLPLGFIAGYGLARFKFAGRGTLMFLFMFSLTIPGLVNLLAIYQAFTAIRLINNPIGLVLVYTASSLPLATWLSRAFILGIPVDIEEAGLVDGCSRIGGMFRITLPLCLPGLGAVAIFVVVHVFQEFIIAQTLVTTRGIGVVSQGLRMMQSQYSLDYTALAAGAILVSIVPVGLFLIMQRQFIAGMTAGSVTS